MNIHIEHYLWGRVEFKPAINCIMIDFRSFLHHHHLALTPPIQPQPHPTTRSQAPPLM